MKSSSTSDDDLSSDSSKCSFDESDSFQSSSDDSYCYSSDDTSSPETLRHQKLNRHHQRNKQSPDRHFRSEHYSKICRQAKQYCKHDSRHQYRQSRHSTSERKYKDEQRFVCEYLPGNKDPVRYKATKKTGKVERDPTLSDMIEQHLIFHQRCDNIEHMLGQLLERSQSILSQGTMTINL